MRRGSIHRFVPAEGAGLFGADAIVRSGELVRVVGRPADGTLCWEVEPVRDNGRSWVPIGPAFRCTAAELRSPTYGQSPTVADVTPESEAFETPGPLFIGRM